MSDDFNEDDPFAEFEDWLVDGPYGAGTGDRQHEGKSQLRSEYQKRIVADNASLLLDREAWAAKVTRFEAALNVSGDPEAAKEMRTRYLIRLDGHAFKDGRKDFSGYRYPCSVSFERVWFGDGNVSFVSAHFSDGSVSFENTSFGSGFVSFIRTTFGNGDVNFEGATFGDGPLTFYNARSGDGLINFHRATFGKGTVSFHSAKFGGFLSFPVMMINGSLNCTALSASGASFRSTTVHGLADWSDATFGTIPDFRQIKLDRPPEVGRMSVPKPQLKHIILIDEQKRRSAVQWVYPQNVASDSNDVMKLRKLKAMAIEANDHEKDGEFFAYEMMAKRGTEHTTFWQLLFNTIYWKVSFYGQSYLRPLAWLGASFATFAAIYSLMAALPIGGWQSLAFGITYSFKNSLPFLGTLTRSVPSPDGHVSWFATQLEAIKGAQPGPDWFTVLGTCQAMLSLFFFFFLLLGLRNKFRLK